MLDDGGVSRFHWARDTRLSVSTSVQGAVAHGGRGRDGPIRCFVQLRDGHPVLAAEDPLAGNYVRERSGSDSLFSVLGPQRPSGCLERDSGRMVGSGADREHRADLQTTADSQERATDVRRSDVDVNFASNPQVGSGISGAVLSAQVVRNATVTGSRAALTAGSSPESSPMVNAQPSPSSTSGSVTAM